MSTNDEAFQPKLADYDARAAALKSEIDRVTDLTRTTRKVKQMIQSDAKPRDIVDVLAEIFERLEANPDLYIKKPEQP